MDSYPKMPDQVAVIGPHGEDVDGEQTQELTKKLMRVLQEYLQPPYARQKVYEVVNALAIVSSVVAASCDDISTIIMFLKSFDTNIELFLKAQENEKAPGSAVH